MSDNVTARIAELLKRRVRCGRTADRYLVGGEARDEIARLRAHVEQLLNAWRREWRKKNKDK